MPASAIGTKRMTWSEAWRLTTILLTQTDSHVAAAYHGWSFPESREARVLADTYDLHHRVAAGKRKPPSYPRGTDPRPVRRGTASMSIDKMRKTLDTHRRTDVEDSGGGVIRG